MRRLDTSILGPLGVAALLVRQSGMAAVASTHRRSLSTTRGTVCSAPGR